jgi:hypothetical protein
MKILFGSLVVAGSGKIGGHVAAKNRGGAYLRTKISPINRKSSYQQAVKQNLIALSQAWRSLTVSQRDAWNAAVGDYVKTDIFGNLRNPSGFNVFVSCNANLINSGNTQITSPVPLGNVTRYEEYEFQVNDYNEDFNIWINMNDETYFPYKSFILWAGKATPYQQKPDISKMKMIGAQLNAGTRNFYSRYIARFGNCGPIGSTQYAYLVFIDSASGIAYQKLLCSYIVAAD